MSQNESSTNVAVAATNSESIHLEDEASTLNAGRRLAERLQRQFGESALVYLQGQLGAGKTTLVRGILQGYGYSGVVKSPTYTLLEPYEINDQLLYHFDLYRVNDPLELEFVGIDEIIDGPGIKLFEWPEQAQTWLPQEDVRVRLEVVASNTSADSGELSRRINIDYFAK